MNTCACEFYACEGSKPKYAFVTYKKHQKNIKKSSEPKWFNCFIFNSSLVCKLQYSDPRRSLNASLRVTSGQWPLAQGSTCQAGRQMQAPSGRTRGRSPGLCRDTEITSQDGRRESIKRGKSWSGPSLVCCRIRDVKEHGMSEASRDDIAFLPRRFVFLWKQVSCGQPDTFLKARCLWELIYQIFNTQLLSSWILTSSSTD